MIYLLMETSRVLTHWLLQSGPGWKEKQALPFKGPAWVSFPLVYQLGSLHPLLLPHQAGVVTDHFIACPQLPFTLTHRPMQVLG